MLAARHVLDGIELVSGTPIGSFASQRDRIALVTTQDIFGQRTHHARSQRKKAAPPVKPTPKGAPQQKAVPKQTKKRPDITAQDPGSGSTDKRDNGKKDGTS